ncbi:MULTISPECIES: hypothetical protein [Alteromonas]|nr:MULTISPECIES: hypothetical protein [Alteromonas]|tara:strand:- start:925 stop:1050 length:126 start_codon:yes stop_codon:yes gene_type:complete
MFTKLFISPFSHFLFEANNHSKVNDYNTSMLLNALSSISEK